MELSWVWGQSRISFYHSKDSIELYNKDEKTQTLAELCKDITPSCRLNPLLFNGHLQTFYTVAKNQDISVYYKRKIFEADDAVYTGSFAVDFVVPPYEGNDEALPPRTTYYKDAEFEEIGSNDNKPMLITLHGLSGGSHEIYLRHVLELLFNEGWEACVVNSRGCAQSKLTSGILFNARATWDIRQTVKWLKKSFPNRPLFAIGYSLGANILINYLGEEGSNCNLEAAVVISNPWNLDTGSIALQRSWLGKEVYSRTMGGNMKKLFETHVEQISRNPRIDVEKVRSIRYLHEFDRELQGPTYGYPTEGAYYRDASSSDSLLAVKTPLFAIHAEDDPIAAMECLPLEEFKQNHYAVLCTTSLGGHLSWFESGGGRWFVKPATQFLIKMAGDIDLSKLSMQKIKDDTGIATRSPFFDPMRRRLQIQTGV
ncbi:hypothetical protein MMC06_004051 [Schaereria dolodes]|nr:hypothetical protein [Schaereria dolodes]